MALALVSIAGAQDTQLVHLRQAEELKWHNDYPAQFRKVYDWVTELRLKSRKNKAPFNDEEMLRLYLSKSFPAYIVSYAMKDPHFAARFNANKSETNEEIRRAKMLANPPSVSVLQSILDYLKDHPEDNTVRANYIYRVTMSYEPRYTPSDIRKLAGPHVDFLSNDKGGRTRSSFVEITLLRYKYRLAFLEEDNLAMAKVANEFLSLSKKYPRSPHLERLYLYIRTYQKRHGLSTLPKLSFDEYNDFALLDRPLPVPKGG